MTTILWLLGILRNLYDSAPAYRLASGALRVVRDAIETHGHVRCRSLCQFGGFVGEFRTFVFSWRSLGLVWSYSPSAPRLACPQCIHMWTNDSLLLHEVRVRHARHWDEFDFWAKDQSHGECGRRWNSAPIPYSGRRLYSLAIMGSVVIRL
jgi:hypothetical protein